MSSDFRVRQSQQEQITAVRMEMFIAIQEKFVSSSILLEYCQQIYPSYSSFWLFRRHFSYQLAAVSFMTYIMQISARLPYKIAISRSTGSVWGSELIPSMSSQRPAFSNTEIVPFRLTPNLQTLIGPIALEGVFSCALMAIARCLTEPEGELEQQLSVFVRDEMIFWFTQQHRAVLADNQLRDFVNASSDVVVKRAVSLAKPPDGALPANQTVIDLIARAVNPMFLAQCDALRMGNI